MSSTDLWHMLTAVIGETWRNRDCCKLTMFVEWPHRCSSQGHLYQPTSPEDPLSCPAIGPGEKQCALEGHLVRMMKDKTLTDHMSCVVGKGRDCVNKHSRKKHYNYYYNFIALIIVRQRKIEQCQ